MKNLKIGLRLGIGFAIALLLLVVVAAIGISRVADLQSEITDLVKDKNVKVKLANDMNEQLGAIARFQRNQLLFKDNPSEVQRAADGARKAREGASGTRTRSGSRAGVAASAREGEGGSQARRRGALGRVLSRA